MTDRPPPLLASRRRLLGGLGAIALLPILPQPAGAQVRALPRLAVALRETPLELRPGQPPTMALRFAPEVRAWNPSLQRGDTLSLELTSPVPAGLNWYGLDGVAQPLPPDAAAQAARLSLPMRAAGTCFVAARTAGEAEPRLLPCGALAVAEAKPPQVDQDEILLIEDWRLKADGAALPPGRPAGDAATLYTINGQPNWTIAARANERLRLRLVNGCHRAVVALRIADHDVRVIAIDGQPAEPFPARDGRLVLSPGTRLDVLVDATRPPGSVSQILLHDGTTPKPVATLRYSADAPVRDAALPLAGQLPGNGLPAQIPFQNAQRFELSVGTAPADGEWLTNDRAALQAAPAFRARRGRTVMLALTNRAKTPVTLRMQGHHFRLLDRLDDGWKPFWLDTLLFDAGQTHRIAFLAEHAGNWPMETIGIDWASPRLTRWYAVE